MLWGISDCFRSLSLSQGQVPHALLTRPPLSSLNASRRINWNSSVRLECVRHAASVHPEPGSNSRNLVSYLISELKSFNSEHWLLFTVFLSIFSSFRINETSVHASFLFALYFQSLVVRFSMTVRYLLKVSLSATAWLLYHLVLSLSIPFLKVFLLFLKFFSSADFLFGRWTLILPYPSEFVNRFLKLFWLFFCNVLDNLILIVYNYHNLRVEAHIAMIKLTL